MLIICAKRKFGVSDDAAIKDVRAFAAKMDMHMHLNKPASRLQLSVIAFAASQVLAFPVFAAQTDAERIVELEKKLEKSLTMIEQLTARVSQVEAGKAKATVPAAVADKWIVQDERIGQLEKDIVQVSANSVNRSDLGVPLHGFADVGYVGSNAKGPNDRKSGFALGTLDLYLTPQFGDRVKSIIELAFEYTDEGALATDLERLQFGYTFSDSLTLWAGRFHTPYGYWNTAFHHGPQIQTSVIRPRFTDFEDKGGILPSHAVGLLASGSVRAGEGKLQYDAYLANGNSITDKVLDFNASKDNNNNKLVGGKLAYEFGGALDGLTLGAHAFTQTVERTAVIDPSDPTNNLPLTNTKVNVYGAFAVLDRDNWELVSEYYRFRNKDLSGATGTRSSWAGFAQLGYTIGQKWTPYVRTEKTVLDQSDNYFLGQDSGRSYQRNALGLRYHLNPQAALKVELNKTEQKDLAQPSTNEVHLQFAVRF